MRRQMAVVAVLALTLSACGGANQGPEDSPAPSSVYAPPPPADTSPPPLVFTTSQETCTAAGEGLALDLITTDPVEGTYLAQWDACSSVDSAGFARTWLRNRTDAVWVMPGITWEERLKYTASADPYEALRAPTFTAMVDEFAELGSTIYLLPGQSVGIARAPEEVPWELDLELTMAWQGQGTLLEQIQEKTPQVLAKATTPKNSVSRAVVVCTFGIYNAAKRAEALDTTDGSDVLVAGLLTTYGGYSCAKESSNASVPLKNGQVSTLEAAAVADLPEDTGLLNRFTNKIRPHQEFIRVATKGALRLFTRGKSG